MVVNTALDKRVVNTALDKQVVIITVDNAVQEDQEANQVVLVTLVQ